MPHVSSLTPGTEVHGWLKIGFALQAVRDVHGNITREVPRKPQVARPNDLSAFAGWVVTNDTVNRVLTVQVHRLEPIYQHAVDESNLVASIPYGRILRLRKLSSERYPAKLDNSFHPTDTVKFYSYRTLEEVSLL